MAIYVIGDIHGCDRSFKTLLKKIKFSPNSDQLYLVGDTINRGPRSVDTLLRILDLQTSAHLTLGNHELGFLVYSLGLKKLKPMETLNELSESRDCATFIDYFRSAQLFYFLDELNIGVAHAAVHPLWTIQDAINLSAEVSVHLQNDDKYLNYVKNMFGNQPNKWDKNLTGMDRLRAITNIFTRTRLMEADMTMDFTYAEDLDLKPANLIPWFDLQTERKEMVIFGHWAALGIHRKPKEICIDSGCFWNGKLSAIRLDDPALPIISVENCDK